MAFSLTHTGRRVSHLAPAAPRSRAAGVVGEDELGKGDKASLTFGQGFEKRFLEQGRDEDREITASLDLGWELLTTLPRSELTRVTMAEIRAHLGSSPR